MPLLTSFIMQFVLLVTIFSGVQELPGETIIINTLGLVIAVFAAMVVYLATNKYYKRIGKLADRKRITIEVR